MLLSGWRIPIEQVAWIAGIGLFVGLFLHRCIERLALCKSIVWPPLSYCDRCFSRLPGWLAIPIFGWLFSRGRCSHCRSRLPWRLLLLPPLTSALLAGYYVVCVNRGAWQYPYFPIFRNYFDQPRLNAIFIYHSILFCLLLAATFIDLDWMIIPDSITVPGMLLGVGLATFWYVELHPMLLVVPPVDASDAVIRQSLRQFFDPVLSSSYSADDLPIDLVQHWRMNWNRWLGFTTSVAGLIAGGGVVWIVRSICTWAFGKEAMGFGDVTLMAMVGAFVGWQLAIVAFFLAPISAVFVGLFGWLLTGRKELPYGPHLSIASAACIVYWQQLWPRCYFLFGHEKSVLIALAMIAVGLLFFVSLGLQWAKRLFGRIVAA